jgi:hypothetical protein
LCKDIKNLDTGKKNITFTVTALKKFIMMITAVHKLNENADKKNYRGINIILIIIIIINLLINKNIIINII